MGLNISHGTWQGSYSAFSRWRSKIAETAGLPPLELMEGFYTPLMGGGLMPTLYHGVDTGKPAFPSQSQNPYLADIDAKLPIKWDCLKQSPLFELLHHSDCDGEISPEKCLEIAKELEKLIPFLSDDYVGGHIGNMKEKTQRFIDGLLLASKSGESVLFG